ncbi:MAG TPA: CARDB domain-containing protein [Acidimicrobiales bacterium]|jgi:subtilase family serine protease|nr:CARDB domain-containing protein [Acidimicrobiales bacterium]
MNIRKLTAVLAAGTCLAAPAAAHALPYNEPEYGVPAEPSPGPDLVVTAATDVRWVLGHEGSYKREVVIRFTVKNQGNRSAGPFKVQVGVNQFLWYGDGGWTGTRIDYLSGLGAGASRSLAPVYVYDKDCVKALAYADSGRQVAETNEANNHRSVVSERAPGWSCR